MSQTSVVTVLLILAVLCLAGAVVSTVWLRRRGRGSTKHTSTAVGKHRKAGR